MFIHDQFGNVINHRLRFFGGGKAKAPKQEKIEMPPMPQIVMPKPPPPPEPIPPAPTVTKSEVQQKEADVRSQAAKRRGMAKSLIAGETGGYLGGGDPSKKNTLG